MSPAQCHAGMGDEIMHQRKTVYAAANAKHPERWSGNIRNWELPSAECGIPEPEKRTKVINRSWVDERDN